MPFKTTEELKHDRRNHLNSLDLLFRCKDSWSNTDRIRGAATIENLTQQVADITAELKMVGAA